MCLVPVNTPSHISSVIMYCSGSGAVGLRDLWLRAHQSHPNCSRSVCRKHFLKNCCISDRNEHLAVSTGRIFQEDT